MNEELQNYKTLYLKEKEKYEKYKAQIDDGKNINSLDSIDYEQEKNIINQDNSNFKKSLTEINLKNDEIFQNGAPQNKILINHKKDEYEQLKDYILNKCSKSNKSIGTYDLFKKNKINKSLKSEKDDNYSSSFYLNQDICDKINFENNYTNNNVLKEVQNGIYDYKNQKSENLERKINNIYFDENQKTINSIIKGNIFEMIDLNFNRLIADNIDKKMKNDILEKAYEFKKDALEKTMNYYKSFLEEYFIQKINDVENNNEFDEMQKKYIFDDFKTRYEYLSNKLYILHKNKKEEMEYNFQSFLKKFYL